ncbi:MAG: PepSY domain-containing protein [Vallitalea sp.]|jgi:hypothetical protein|nr:PepSY domain-containing protein [Vallitalea sp.]
MDNKSSNYVEQYLDNQNRKKRKRKKIIIIVLSIILVANLINFSYKKYINYKNIKNADIDYIINTNIMLVNNYNRYFLKDAKESCINILFKEDSENIDKQLLFKNNVIFIDQLYDIHMSKYIMDHDDIYSFTSFLKDSSRCIKQLEGQENITEEQKEYVSSIYETYNELSELFNKLMTENLYSCKDSQEEAAEYHLFYEGKFLYDYINLSNGIINNISSVIETEQSIAQDKQHELFIENEKESKKNALSEIEANTIARDFSKVIFDYTKELKVSKKTYEEYSASGKIGISEDGRGDYLTDITYTSNSFNANEQIIIDLVHNDAYYANYHHKTESILSYDEIDDIASSIINRLGNSSIILTDKYKPTSDNYFYSYYYLIGDENYEDQTQNISLILYGDGQIQSLSINNETLYNNYEKIKPKISLEQAKNSLTNESRKNILHWKLINQHHDMYYEFTINKYNNTFYILVDANIGEIDRIN